MKRGDAVEARELLRDAVRIAEKDFGPEHPMTARMRAINGLLLMHERHYAAADSTLRAATQQVERQLGRASPVARELYGWLADVEDARSHHAEAARYRAIARGDSDLGTRLRSNSTAWPDEAATAVFSTVV
jgi:hypothetical protein